MTDNRRAANGKKQTDRIAAMERRMDAAAEALQALETALDGYEAALPGLAALAAYYDGGDWRRDFEADEAGKLPPDLKRGVLSEDALYDLLTKQTELEERLRRLPADEIR